MILDLVRLCCLSVPVILMAGNLRILYPVHAIFTVVSFLLGCISEYRYYTNVRIGSFCDRSNRILFAMYRFEHTAQNDFWSPYHSVRWSSECYCQRQTAISLHSFFRSVCIPIFSFPSGSSTPPGFVALLSWWDPA